MILQACPVPSEVGFLGKLVNEKCRDGNSLASGLRLGGTNQRLFIGLLYFALRYRRLVSEFKLQREMRKTIKSRKKTIKPARLVIQWILLWLVGINLLCSAGPVFLSIIHLTNCHPIRVPPSTPNHTDVMRCTHSGETRCRDGTSALPFGYSSLKCFQTLHDWTQTLWHLHSLGYGGSSATSN